MTFSRANMLLQMCLVPQDQVVIGTQQCRAVGRQLRRIGDDFEAHKLEESKRQQESQANFSRILFVTAGVAVLGRILWRCIAQLKCKVRYLQISMLYHACQHSTYSLLFIDSPFAGPLFWWKRRETERADLNDPGLPISVA